jgi:hypothetical protein
MQNRSAVRLWVHVSLCVDWCVQICECVSGKWGDEVARLGSRGAELAAAQYCRDGVHTVVSSACADLLDLHMLKSDLVKTQVT